MHLCKRLSGALLALVLIITVLPSASARQFYTYLLDSNDAAEIAEMVDAISDQTFSVIGEEQVLSYIEHFLYKSNFAAVSGGRFPYTNASGYWSGKTVSDGTYSQVVSATGCYAYCKFVSQVMYGTAGTRLDLNEKAGKITGDGLKAFLQDYAQAGEHIRVDGKHSVTFVSGTEDGFYYMDYAGDQNPRIWLRYSTYSNFAAYCNSLYKRVWLYDADPAINVEKADEPAAWLAQYIAAAGELGLVDSGSALSCSDALTVAETVTIAARAHSLLTTGSAAIEATEGANWYDTYVNYLMGKQLLPGGLDYAELTSRRQFVELLYAVVPAGMELTVLNDGVVFADVAEEESEAVNAFYQAGLLTGVEQEDGVYFCPNATISRGEAIALVTRLAIADLRVSQN